MVKSHVTRAAPPPTPTSPAASTPATVRLHGLDAIRGGALLLGIVLHGLMPFLPGKPWLVNDIVKTPAVLAAIGPIHMFRMALFLFIAGWFGSGSLARRGTLGYLRDRALRLVVPLFAFWPIAVLGLVPFIVLDARRAGRPLDVGGGEGFTPGQLWFLWVLFECAVVAVAVAWVLRRSIGAEHAASGVAVVGRLLIAPGGVLLAAVPYAAALVLQGSAGGIREPTTLVPELAGLVRYLGAFAVGWALSVTPGSLDALRARVGVHLGVAVVLTLVHLLVVGDRSVSGPALVGWAVLFAVASWCWVFGLTGAAVRWLTRERFWVRYLADSSY